MTRSFWKGKYLSYVVFKRFINWVDVGSLVYVRTRSLFIFKQFLGVILLCLNGFEYKRCMITKQLLFYKIGSFVLTRQFGIVHIPKKTKKQKELEERKRKTKNLKPKKKGEIVIKKTKGKKIKNKK